MPAGHCAVGSLPSAKRKVPWSRRQFATRRCSCGQPRRSSRPSVNQRYDPTIGPAKYDSRPNSRFGSPNTRKIFDGFETREVAKLVAKSHEVEACPVVLATSSKRHLATEKSGTHTELWRMIHERRFSV